MIVTEVVNMLAKGASDDEVREHVRERHKKSKSTAERYLAQALDILQRRTAKQRPVLVARQSAKLEAAQKASFDRVREMMTKDGQVVSLLDPDLGTFVRAVEAQNKLLGLNAPEQMQLLVANANALVRDVAELIAEFLPEPAARRAFLDEMVRRVEARVRTKTLASIEVPALSSSKREGDRGEEDSPLSAERNDQDEENP